VPVASGIPFATIATTTSVTRSFVTVAILFTVSAQSIFVANFVGTMVRRAPAAEKNPWRASTLEWSLPSPPPLDNFTGPAPIVFRGAYEFYATTNRATDFVPQYLATEDISPAIPGNTDTGLRPLTST
jgi:heme/copper-type cytochrome/quinol oxidase subunit 1